MIPDYKKFIRYQDKKVILFIYFIVFITSGFYFKNLDFSPGWVHASIVGIMMGITLYHLTTDLRAYWVYSAKLKRIDLSSLSGKGCTKFESLLSRPLLAGLFFIPVAWLIVFFILSFTQGLYAVLLLLLILPLLMYAIYYYVRYITIKQILNSVPSGVKYSTLYCYVSYYVISIFMVNILSVSPLSANPSFSLTEGFFNAKLMIAMLILNAIILALNLIFILLTKRYIFFGRIYLGEIDFSFSNLTVLSSMKNINFFIRMLFLLVVQLLWIFMVSIVLDALHWRIYFEFYFFLCFIPCLAYYFLHIYWHWQNEFVLACDMCLRYEEMIKRETW